MTDTRRYRSKASGRVYEVVVQSRSLNGSVTLRDPTDGVAIRTTNDRLAVDYELFRVGESDDGEAHAAHLDEIVAQRNLAVAQAVAAEREACAALCDDAAKAHARMRDERPLDEQHRPEVARLACEDLAEKIRARGKATP